MTSVLIKRAGLNTDMGGGGNAMYKLELCCRKPRNYQKQRKGPGADISLVPQREHSSANTLILDFEPPEL